MFAEGIAEAGTDTKQALRTDSPSQDVEQILV